MRRGAWCVLRIWPVSCLPNCFTHHAPRNTSNLSRLARAGLFRSVRRVMLVLRFIGVLNAAVWLGAAFFFTFAVAPAFFTPEVKEIFHGRFWPGVMAQFVVERYFYLQQICG